MATLEREQARQKDAIYGDNVHAGLLARTKSLEDAFAEQKESRHWLIGIAVGLFINALLILLSAWLGKG